MTRQSLIRETACEAVGDGCHTACRRLLCVIHPGRLVVAAAMLVALLAGVLPGSASGQVVPQPPPLSRGDRTEPGPEEMQAAGVEEKLGEQVPGDLRFRDSEGHDVTLADYFDNDRPIILNLGYFHCPMLCGMVTDALSASLTQLRWTPGDEFDVLTVSFDPAEGPIESAPAKERVIARLDRPEAAGGWHFLTGEQEAIDRLTEAVGFNYVWSERHQEWVHTAAIIVLMPDGRVARYLYGLGFEPETVRLSLVEASEGKAGSVMDQIFLYCFRFDDEVGAYTAVAMNMMRLGAVLTLLGLATAISVMAIVGKVRRRRIATGESS